LHVCVGEDGEIDADLFGFFGGLVVESDDAGVEAAEIAFLCVIDLIGMCEVGLVGPRVMDTEIYAGGGSGISVEGKKQQFFSGVEGELIIFGSGDGLVGSVALGESYCGDGCV